MTPAQVSISKAGSDLFFSSRLAQAEIALANCLLSAHSHGGCQTNSSKKPPPKRGIVNCSQACLVCVSQFDLSFHLLLATRLLTHEHTGTHASSGLDRSSYCVWTRLSGACVCACVCVRIYGCVHMSDALPMRVNVCIKHTTSDPRGGIDYILTYSDRSICNYTRTRTANLPANAHIFICTPAQS